MTKKLLNAIKMSSRITVYVPATKNINEAIDNSEYVDATAKLLADCFGGATSTAALGYWLSPTAGLTAEKTTMVFAYCKEADLETYIDDVVMHCETLKHELSQDAVSIEINGEMYFI